MMSSKEIKLNLGNQPDTLSRRSFLGAILAIGAAVTTGCDQVISSTETETETDQGLIYSLYPDVHKLLKQTDHPEVLKLANEYLQSYLENRPPAKNIASTHGNLYPDRPDPYNCITVLTKDQFIQHYARNISHLLYLDMQGQLPWSLSEQPLDNLRLLLDPPNHYSNERGEIICSPLAPSYPEDIFGFLRQHNLIKQTHQETIENLIDWFRARAIHIFPTDEQDKELLAMYGHLGAPTVTDMFGRTERNEPIKIQGCPGSVEFFKQLLQVLGIPVEKFKINLGDEEGLHSSIRFSSLQKSLYHGDDLHAFWSSTYEGEKIPPGNLLVDSYKLMACSDSEANCTDYGYAHALYRLELSEGYLTERELLYHAYFQTGAYKEAIYSKEYNKGIELPQNRLDKLYQRYNEKLLEIGGGSYFEAIRILTPRCKKIFSNH